MDLKEGDVAAPVSEDFLNFKTALVVFKEATRLIPGMWYTHNISINYCFTLFMMLYTVYTISDDVEFHVSFLPIVQLFEEAGDIKSEIYERYKFVR